MEEKTIEKIINFPITKKNLDHLDKFISILDGDEIVILDYFNEIQNLCVTPLQFQLAYEYLSKKYQKTDFEFRLHNFPFCLAKCDFMQNSSKKNEMDTIGKKQYTVCKKCKFNIRCAGLWENQNPGMLKTIPDLPSEIVIEISSRCIKNCEHCFNTFEKNIPELTTAQAKGIISQVSKDKIPNIRFTGGEPLLRKDIIELIDYSKSKGLNVRLNTNGYLLNNFMKDGKPIFHVDYLLISFNDFEDKKAIDAINLAYLFADTIIVGTIAFTENIATIEEFHEKLKPLLKHVPGNKSRISGWEFYRPIQDVQLSRQDISLLVSKLSKLGFPIANAIPFCSNGPGLSNMKKFNSISLGAKFDDGHSRMIVDPKGYLKPSYVIDKNLGDIPKKFPALANISFILKAWGNPYIKKIRSLGFAPSYCIDCIYLDKCKGGSRYFATKDPKQKKSASNRFDPLMRFRLKHLVIKPTLDCPGNCIMCKERQDLYKKIKSDPKNKSITFDKWKKLLHEAKSMGVEKLTISGGEPTLYPHLYWLIRYSKSLGFTTLLNTNGINLKEDIIATELDAITFSLESLKTDSLRDGRYTKKIIELIPKLKNKIHININTIMTKQNFKDIPDIYRYCKENSLNLILSYLEFFDDKSIRNTANGLKMGSKDYDSLIKQIPVLKDQIQKKSSSPKCTVPGNFALILPNGDVHPCNIVEYAHEPIMGNVLDAPLHEIWEGQKFHNFRAELHNGCKNCMIPQRIFLNHDGSNDKHLSFQLS